jgi:hypothetical protein
MNTKITFTRRSPIRTVLVNEETGRELYKIDTPIRFVGSITRVFRCDSPTTCTPNPMSNYLETDEPHEGRSSEEWNPPAGEELDDPYAENGNEGESGVDGAGGEAVAESPLVKNEIARWYWKWFSSPRIVFEGKISTRAEYMPLKSRVRR